MVVLFTSCEVNNYEVMKKFYALIFEYAGSNYCGFQYQKHSKSIQEHLEKALSVVANESIKIICAGRTDTGVHALAQVAHFITKAERQHKAWTFGVNYYLPPDIKVLKVYEVKENFSARFSALYRRYQYVFYIERVNTALWYKRVKWINKNLDIEQMNLASKYLLGEQDFSCFRSSQCQSSSAYRYIHHAYFKKYGKFVVFDIKGNAFLHHMVRNIAGSMLEVGFQKKPKSWIKELILSKDRTKAGITVSPEGLYLVEIGYPKNFDIVACQNVPFIY